MPDMPAHTYEALNRAITALGQVISSARYGNDRKGIIPVLAMPEVLAEITDAVATIDDLTTTRDPRPEEGVAQALTPRYFKTVGEWEEMKVDDGQYAE